MHGNIFKTIYLLNWIFLKMKDFGHWKCSTFLPTNNGHQPYVGSSTLPPLKSMVGLIKGIPVHGIPTEREGLISTIHLPIKILFYEDKSTGSFCWNVAVRVSDMFCNFYLLKNYKSANNSTTTKGREKISADLESSTFKTSKFISNQILLYKISQRCLITIYLISETISAIRNH